MTVGSAAALMRAWIAALSSLIPSATAPFSSTLMRVSPALGRGISPGHPAEVQSTRLAAGRSSNSMARAGGMLPEVKLSSVTSSTESSIRRDVGCIQLLKCGSVIVVGLPFSWVFVCYFIWGLSRVEIVQPPSLPEFPLLVPPPGDWPAAVPMMI